MSRDIENILILIDGREPLVSEIAAAPREIQRYIASQFEMLLKNNQFENAVAGNLRGDKDRIDLAFKRISESIEIGRRC